MGLLLIILVIDYSNANQRTITYVDIDGVHNNDHTFNLINERHKRDLELPRNALIDQFTKPFNTSEAPEFPQELREKNETITTNKTNETIIDNHTYYNVSYLYDQSVTNEYWINMKDIKESVRHEMLSSAHRRAATVRLSFKFPFYGYKIENVTIATGGFLFLGEAVHTWLAATQYIAPLMANFNTSINQNSSIYYYDNKTSFTVQWDNVYLQEVTVNGTDANGKSIRNTIEKPFSFQATLKDNGDIIFVYKQIPFEISKINEEKHPVKVGISDAYIIDRTIFFIRRKTIYEYHKAELKNKQILNNTVIYFKAIPTCNSFNDCTSCLTKKVSFECSWCEATKKCSDGYDRHRQDWLKNKCDDNSIQTVAKCAPAPPANSEQINKEEHSSSDTAVVGPNVKPAVISISGNDVSSQTNANQQEKLKGKTVNGKENKQSRKGGIAFMFIIMCLVVLLAYWAMYAYRNPQSKPGQWMIKYRRPSQWRFSNNNSESS